jgi:hypothetical protein
MKLKTVLWGGAALVGTAVFFHDWAVLEAYATGRQNCGRLDDHHWPRIGSRAQAGDTWGTIVKCGSCNGTGRNYMPDNALVAHPGRRWSN